MELLIKTAGMTHGTPDWQLDNQYEAESAAEWEKQNGTEVTALNRKSFDSLNRAWAALETARLDFESLQNYIATACQHIDGTTEGDKLASIYDTLSDLRIEVKAIREKLRNEKHEAYTDGRCAG